MLSDVEKGKNMMLTRLTPAATLVWLLNLSVIFAPFGTVFGYFWLKKSGNPVLVISVK